MAYRQYSQNELKKRYGATADAVRKQMVTVVFDLGANVIQMPIHKKAAKYYSAACKDYRKKIKAGKAKPYRFKPKSCGSFCWRVMRGGTLLSMHSWAIAVDFNAYTPNGFGKLNPNDIPKELIKSFAKYKIYWGGYWSYPDPMHFEFAPLSFPSKPKAAPKKYAKGSVVKALSTLNLRKKATTLSNIVKELAKGTKMIVVADKGKWLKVKVGNATGYVSEKYVKKYS
jgi:hypothetical protein